MVRTVFIGVIGAVLLLLSSLVFSLDAVFEKPIQEPKEIVRKIYVPVGGQLSFAGISNYEIKTVRVKVTNLTLLYPFTNVEKVEVREGSLIDEDDAYFLTHYDSSDLASCARNATSIAHIYNCVKDFVQTNGGSCRVATSAFKVAFLNSPLRNSSGFSLMKAYVRDPSNPWNAHRFILLKNKNGYYVIDPYWGIFRGLEDSVVRYTKMFYDDPGSPNYRGKVYKVVYFHGG